MCKWCFVAALALAGCKTVAHGDLFETDIAERLAELGQAGAEVECPDRIPLGLVKDNHFDCVITFQSGETEVTVQLDEKGAWRLKEK